VLAAVAAGTTGEELFPFFTVELSSPVLNLAAAVGWSSVFATGQSFTCFSVARWSSVFKTGRVLRVFQSRGGLRFSSRAEFYLYSVARWSSVFDTGRGLPVFSREVVFSVRDGQLLRVSQSRGFYLYSSPEASPSSLLLRTDTSRNTIRCILSIVSMFPVMFPTRCWLYNSVLQLTAVR